MDHLLTKTIDELVAALKAHFEPENDREMVTFVADLKKLSLTCNFNDHLQDTLKDQFFAGLRTDDTKPQ